MVQITPLPFTVARSQFGAYRSYSLEERSVIFDTQEECQRFVDAVNNNPHLGYTLGIEMVNKNNPTKYIQDANYLGEEFVKKYGRYGTFIRKGLMQNIEKTFSLVKGQEYEGLKVNA